MHTYNILNNCVTNASQCSYLEEYCKNGIQTKKPKPTTFNDLIQNSDEFKIKFPNERCRIKNQPRDSLTSIADEGSTAYPVILEHVLILYCSFLEHKKKFGTEIEKNIYEEMTMEGFIERLLMKRCVSFFGKNERYLLRSGEVGNSGFKAIGTVQEQPPLIMEDYLTYDEIKLSAFISFSSTFKNRVMIGICGPEMSRKGLMDYQDVIIAKVQNQPENGYGKMAKNVSKDIQGKFDKRSIWNTFYRCKVSQVYNGIDRKETRGKSWRSPKELQRYIRINNTTDFCDSSILENRYCAMIMLILQESNARAKEQNKMAYVWINKSRMGLEKMTNWQEEYFLRIFVSVTVLLFGDSLYNIYCIHFENFAENCWIKDDTILNNNNDCDPYFWNKHPNKGIKIRLSTTDADRDYKKSIRDDENYVNISTYTANANSLPGNEFWMKKINTCDKNSTSYLACHSFISELHNPFINRPMISARNLHIATEYNVHHISEYSEMMLK
ncbi:uncharacterized protein DMENIID0001_053010 [Sergentomyia squamirostris]